LHKLGKPVNKHIPSWAELTFNKISSLEPETKNLKSKNVVT
jgi:hypothetical protein